MTADELRHLAPPDAAQLAPEVHALWAAAQNDWHTAHELAQASATPDGAWVHAYLHRLEGDQANAAYWYRRAGQRVAAGDHEAEWHAIASGLLSRQGK